MIFKGTDNQTLEFRITNYEFPNVTDCEYDSNWLLIYLNVNSKSGKWKTVNPSLLVFEVKDIIDWFADLSLNKTEKKNLTFIEPNLEFDLIKENSNFKTVRIKFDLESRPENADGDKDYYIDFDMNNSELKNVAEELKLELKPFPNRGV